mgnify:FL=1
MSRNGSILRNIDWWTILLVLFIALFGWINIYGASYNYEQSSIFSLDNRAGKQFLWMMISLVIAFVIMLIDSRTYDSLAYILYAVIIVVLLITPLIARNVKGSYSWISIGGFQLQPAEFAKFITALALAKYMGQFDYSIRSYRDMLVPCLLVLVPMFIIIVLQRETGSALVFLAFVLMFYREGMSGYVILSAFTLILLFVIAIRLSVFPLPLGIGNWGTMTCVLIILLIEEAFLFFKYGFRNECIILPLINVFVFAVALVVNIWHEVNFNIVSVLASVISVAYLGLLSYKNPQKKLLSLLLFVLFSSAFSCGSDYAFNKILQPHQRTRIEVLLGLKDDPHGVGYNANQAKIAIGSGRFAGKGFRQGTQTQMKFVPEQATDFIFCTVGEEWGFVGTSGLLIAYLVLLLRLISLCERQKDKFSQIYGYCVVGILFFHIAINIGMVLGVLPVIGIPLPFFSYGGSSLVAFTLLLSIFLKLDASRVEKMR